MLEISDNGIEITKDDGSVESWKIYFYYHNEERGKDFYFIYKEGDPDNLVVMASKDGKELLDVSDEEFAEAQEMLETYESDPKIGRIK